MDTSFEGVTLPDTLYAMPRRNQACALVSLADDGHVDAVAVDQAISGHKPRITYREMLAAVGKLAASGCNDLEIADRLRFRSHAAVEHTRRRHGIPSGNGKGGQVGGGFQGGTL